MNPPVRSVSFLLSSLKFGGGERVALNLAHAFKARGIRVDFLLMSYEGEFLEEAEKFFNVVDICCRRTWMLPGKLSSYLWQSRPDALIASFWKLNLCACLTRLVYPRIQLLLWEHSPPSKSTNSPTWLYGITASLMYRLATRVVSVSNGVRNDITRITFGLDTKIKVIFNPILPPLDLKAKLQPQTSRSRIVWVGRMDYPKNPVLMLEAFALLSNDQSYTLDFIGDGPLRTVLEQRVEELGLQERVMFRGFQSDPYTWMMQSDLLALTSDREGLPTVLIEALYCGLRLVSTDSGGGVHEVLRDNHYGAIVPPGNAAALAQAIITEFERPCDSDRQIEGSHRFLPAVIAQQFLLLLKAIPDG